MIQFFIEGNPSPGGSKRGFMSRHPSKKTGKHFVVMQDMGGKNTENWRANCAFFARAAFNVYGGRDLPPFNCPLQVCFEFYRVRPKNHYNARGELKASAPAFPTGAPDTTKLIRSTEDALKHIAWLDDSLIVRQSASKEYADKPGCRITIYPMSNHLELPLVAAKGNE